ncbi:hypothetical protein F5Y03DRAFT_22890 [Xylaria venustula]|nr:hypothetical protein F5Y03DRAFT_22890 [Xylaria venustula]
MGSHKLSLGVSPVRRNHYSAIYTHSLSSSSLINTPFDEPQISVDIEKSATASYNPPRELDYTVTTPSSFDMFGGFCKGAKEAQQGRLGFERVKRHAGGFSTNLVAKCTHCLFELDWKNVEKDLNNDSSGNFSSSTVTFRLRFLQKTHLSIRHVDQQIYGCPFCIQQGHTTEESDATVFASHKQLFQHLARHLRPLPIVPGFAVIQGTAIPPHLENNFDLYFPHPPLPSAMVGIKKELSSLPTAVATVKAEFSLLSTQLPPGLEQMHCLVVGAKIFGIEFPARYEGKWALGWHDNFHAAFETETVQLIMPPENQLQLLARTTNASAVARWEWNPTDSDGRWLKCKEGDIIHNISWIRLDDWYWSGTTSKGWGIFPSTHIDPESITVDSGRGKKVEPLWAGLTKHRRAITSDLANSRWSMSKSSVGAHYKQSASDRNHFVQQLREIGISEKGIGALPSREIDWATDMPIATTDYSTWLKRLATRLTDQFSETRDTDFAESAIQLVVASRKETTSSVSNQIEWLNDLGSKIGASDTTANKSSKGNMAIFQWEIPSVFYSRDSVSDDDMDLRAEMRDFVVLSGSDGAFEATTCIQYIEDKFGAPGLEVFETVVDVLSSVASRGFLLKTRKSSEKTHVPMIVMEYSRVLQVDRVSRSCITLTTQANDFNPVHIACMEWLCQAVREIPAHPSSESDLGRGLMKSRVSPCLELWASDVTRTPPIITFALEPLQHLSKEEIGNDCCWIRLFKSAVIAWTPLSRSWGTGLQLNYEMLIRLAAVTNYVYINSSTLGNPIEETTGENARETTSGLIAIGFFTALIPIAYDPTTNSTQWHLEVTNDSIMKPEELKILRKNWLQVKTPSTFSESHCYLGWKGNVSVTLGTKEGCYDLQWTDLPKVERVFRLEGFEIGGEIGIGDVIPISLKQSGSLSFKACSTVQRFTASAHYEQAIQLLSRHVALVYDSESQIAWLVPQLSWNLHLCHVWYRHAHDEKSSHDPVPFARVSPDGSSAACEALHKQSDLTVLDGLSLSQLFLQIYHNMASSNQYRQKPRKSRIFGTETMDLIEEPGVGSLLRRLDLPEVDESWQYLAAKADSIGFCKGLGQALKPQDQNPDHKCGCDVIPNHRSLLVAHNTCIERLLKRESTNMNSLQNGIVVLDDGRKWFMENWPFDTCTHSPEQDYWAAANISMQRIAKPRRWTLSKKANDWKGHLSPIPAMGAFVFGNPPYKESQIWDSNKWLAASQKSIIP